MRVKRVASILLALLMLVASVRLGVFATSNHPVPDSLCCTYSLDGSLLTLEFSLDEEVNDTSLIFSVSYDSSAVTFYSAQTSRDWAACGKTKGEYSASFSQIVESGSIPSGVLCTFVFTVNASDLPSALFGIHGVEPVLTTEEAFAVPLRAVGFRSVNLAVPSEVLTYVPDSTGESLSVSSCLTSASGSLCVPMYVDGLPVTGIEAEAFSDCTRLTNITLPATIRSVGARAFEYCTSLAQVKIVHTVTSVGEYAFSNCSALKSLNISLLSSVPQGCFEYCTSLESAVIRNGVSSIGDGAFSGCSALKEVFLPYSVLSIGVRTFSGCRALSDVTLQDGVESIGERAFSDCISLRQLFIPASVTSVGSLCFSSRTTVYSPEASAACTAAREQGTPYAQLAFDPAAVTGLDAQEKILFTHRCCNISEYDLVCSATPFAAAVVPCGGWSTFGTGSVAAVYLGSELEDSYTLVVYGDISGDSMADALDLMLAELALNTPFELNTYQLLAADLDRDGVFTQDDFDALGELVVER